MFSVYHENEEDAGQLQQGPGPGRERVARGSPSLSLSSRVSPGRQRLRQVTLAPRKESSSSSSLPRGDLRVHEPRFKRHSLQGNGPAGQRKQALYRPLMERRRDVWCRSFTDVSPSSAVRKKHDDDVEDEDDDDDDDDDDDADDDSEDGVGVYRSRSCGGGPTAKDEDSREREKLLPAAGSAGSDGVAASSSPGAARRADPTTDADVHDDSADSGSEYTRRLLMKRTSVPRLIHMKAVINESPSTSMSSSELSSPHVETDTSLRQCLLPGHATTGGGKKTGDADTRVVRLAGIDSPFGGEASDKSTDLSRSGSAPEDDGDGESGVNDAGFGGAHSALHNPPSGLPSARSPAVAVAVSPEECVSGRASAAAEVGAGPEPDTDTDGPSLGSGSYLGGGGGVQPSSSRSTSPRPPASSERTASATATAAGEASPLADKNGVAGKKRSVVVVTTQRPPPGSLRQAPQAGPRSHAAGSGARTRDLRAGSAVVARGALSDPAAEPNSENSACGEVSRGDGGRRSSGCTSSDGSHPQGPGGPRATFRLPFMVTDV